MAEAAGRVVAVVLAEAVSVVVVAAPGVAAVAVVLAGEAHRDHGEY